MRLSKFRTLFYGGMQVARRDQFIRSWLASLLRGKELLDAGAGPQRFKPDCSHLKYVSQDFCQYKGAEIFAGKQTLAWNTGGIDIVSDITRIPLNDATVDHILCVEVLEHVPQPLLALREFHRLLRIGGSALITVPFNSQYHQDPFFFYSGFSSHWFRYVAEHYGFSVVQMVPNGNYYELLAQEVLVIGTLRSGVLRVIYPLVAFPFLMILKLFDSFAIPAPKAPFGYFVELRKEPPRTS